MIEVDARNLQDGADASWIGLDSVAFGQVKPPRRVQARFYMAPRGSDGDPGTEEQPFRTLERSRKAVRAINGAMTGDIEVVLREGTYELAQTLVLTWEDSGANGYKVIYRAHEGERVVISGGRRITDWSDPDGDGIWEAPNRLGLPYSRQLWVNGERRPRASGVPPAGLHQTNFGYRTDPDSPAREMLYWRNLGDVEFLYVIPPPIHAGGLPHTASRVTIDRITPSGEIVMKQPAWRNLTERDEEHLGPPHRWPPYRVENAYELLDEPGEWVLARDEGKFYYFPRPGENPNEVEVIAPVLETLVSGQGTKEAPVRNIQFVGLQFSYATFLRPGGPDGYTEIGTGYCNTGEDGIHQGLPQYDPVKYPVYGVWTKTPANVTFTYAQDLRFERVRFAHLGATALDFLGGSQYNEIVGCMFVDVSANGIEIGGVDKPKPTDPRDVVRGNQVRNSIFTRVGAEYFGCAGILATYVQETLIAHNLLHDLPSVGIHVGWGIGWHETTRGIFNRDNRVTANHIYDHVQVVSDYSAIYAHGKQGNSYADALVIDGNVIHGQRHRLQPIFTDGSSQWIRICHNAIYDNDGAAYQILPMDREPLVRAWGGCFGPPIGDPLADLVNIDFSHNYYEGVIPLEKRPENYAIHPKLYWSCDVPPGDYIVADNKAVDSAADVRAAGGGWILDRAGLEREYQDLLEQ